MSSAAAAAAAPTSENFDNPWESAANDEVYRSTTLRVDEGSQEVASPSPSSSPTSESVKNRCIWWNQLLDGFLGALFIVFSFFLYHKNSVNNNTTHLDLLTMVLLLFFVMIAFILLLRSILGRQFFHFNMNSRPILVLAYLATATVLYADAKHLPEWILKLELERTELLPLVLVCFAILEVILFCVLRHCHLSELEDIRDAENLHRYTTRPGLSPWWWGNHHRNGGTRQNDENLQEPLLFGQPSWTNASNNYQVQDGINTSSSWWPFSGGGRNARDDGSVDYASLNEDWASRSQADPYWWSRDGDEDNGNS